MKIIEDLSGLLVGLITFTIIFLFAVGFFIYAMRVDDKSERFEYLKGFTGLLFVSIIGIMLFLFCSNYKYKVTQVLNPEDVEVAHDDYEVVIYYNIDQKFNITDDKRYDRILDGRFYIEEKTYYNVFGAEQSSEFKLITYVKKDKESVKIEL